MLDGVGPAQVLAGMRFVDVPTLAKPTGDGLLNDGDGDDPAHAPTRPQLALARARSLAGLVPAKPCSDERNG